MFEVGDRVQTNTDDFFSGEFGEVVELHEEVLTVACVLMDKDAKFGRGPLWFDFSELRKVESA